MSAPFILRPIATTLLIVAIMLLGVLGYRTLPIAPLPSVDFPTIQVITPYPGASATVVETSITAPLEHYFGTISGLVSMSSTSSYGNSQITLQFDLSRKIDSAAQDVVKARAARGDARRLVGRIVESTIFGHITIPFASTEEVSKRVAQCGPGTNSYFS